MSNQSVLSDPFFDSLQRFPLPEMHGKVIPREDYRDFYEANNLVEDALERASDLASEIENATEEARKAGYEHGLGEAKNELAKKLNILEQQVGAFYENAEETVLDISFRVVRRFFKSRIDSREIQNLITQTIAERESSRPYAIHVASDSQDLISAAVRDLERIYPDMRLPIVQVDPRLRSGRAVLMTRYGTVDLDVDSQLDALHESLAGKGFVPGSPGGVEAVLQ